MYRGIMPSSSRGGKSAVPPEQGHKQARFPALPTVDMPQKTSYHTVCEVGFGNLLTLDVHLWRMGWQGDTSLRRGFDYACPTLDCGGIV